MAYEIYSECFTKESFNRMHEEISKPAKPGPGRSGKAGRLTHARVIKAAINVVRQEGLDGLTMKRVAEQLGCGVMSLYHHIRNRDDLLDGMLDHVAATIAMPPDTPSPVDHLTEFFAKLYAAFRRDPWIVRCLIDGHPGSPVILPMMEKTMLAIEALGWEGAEAGHVYHSLLHYTYGEVLVMDALDRKPEFLTARGNTSTIDFPALERTLGVIECDTEAPEHYQRNLRRLLSSIGKGA